MTWGDMISGSYCITVKAALRIFDEVYSTRKTFAEFLNDGTVVIWVTRTLKATVVLRRPH